MKLALQSARLDPASLLSSLRQDGCGALVSFVGTVRNHHLGRAVTHLDYSAYEPMALRVLETIAKDCGERWPEVELTCHHRLGRLKVGEDAVVIVAAGPHRVEAFEACSFFLERLKQDCPIWKKEWGPDGASWVSPRP